jgi:rhamnosyltransferase
VLSLDTIRAVSAPDISVIVRARDEERSIGRCLELVGRQRTDGLGVETIVVDTGSTDRTVAIATASGARIVRTDPARFSFGGALNLGAANARAPVLVALSADAFATDPDWLARLAGHLGDSQVACASGEWWSPQGRRLHALIRQDLSLAERYPRWGYSNGAGGFRADLWRRRPFREDLPGCEDQDWALHWLRAGYVCVIDPDLAVEHDHSHDRLADIYRRARREAHGFAMFLGADAYGPHELAHDWWSDRRFYDSRLRALFSHRRAVRLLGAYAGSRRGRRS